MALMASIAVDMQDKEIDDVLDKIKIEVTELFKASGVSNSSLCFAVLQIIDKYKEGSEDRYEDNN